jgi:hypothetical protein
MALPVWPAVLPQALRPNYSGAYGDGRLRSKTDAGGGKQRRRFSNTARPVQAEIWIDAGQKMALDDFLDLDIAGGALPFLMFDPERDGLALLDSAGNMILDSSGAPIGTRRHCIVQLDDMPQIASVGLRYRIGLSLFVMP